MLISLFGASFLAATILPLSSEAALSASIIAGKPVVACILAAWCGNTLGSMLTFYLGRLGKLEWLNKYLKVTEENILKTRKKIRNFGFVAAFFCFLPFVGDLVSITLGYIRFNSLLFFVSMAVGKLSRYILWAYVHINITSSVL